MQFCSLPSTRPAHPLATPLTLALQLFRSFQHGKSLPNAQPHTLLQKKKKKSTFATSALATRLVVQVEILVGDTATVVEVVLRGARKKEVRDERTSTDWKQRSTRAKLIPQYVAGSPYLLKNHLPAESWQLFGRRTLLQLNAVLQSTAHLASPSILAMAMLKEWVAAPKLLLTPMFQSLELGCAMNQAQLCK